MDEGAGPSTAAGAGASGAVMPAEPEVDMSKHPSGIIPQLQNVVATVNLGCPLDLKEIALHARNAEYNPKRFAAVIMRIREPKTTALIFASGKMVCTGAKSEADSRLAARKYARIVQKLGFPAEFKEFKIQNIVGSCDAKFPIRLEGLSYSHAFFATYEPELFPGLIYRMKAPKIVLLIFVSGKVVLTGAKRREEIYEAFEAIYPTLMQFKKTDAAGSSAAGTSSNGTAAGTPALPGPGSAGAGAGTGTGGGPSGATQPSPMQEMRAPAAVPGSLSAAAGTMAPPKARAGSMMPPPAATPMVPPAATPLMPAPSATPAPHMPPATPAHQPPATPAYQPPATPAYQPPATPAYQPQSTLPAPVPRLPPATPRHPNQ